MKSFGVVTVIAIFAIFYAQCLTVERMQLFLMFTEWTLHREVQFIDCMTTMRNSLVSSEDYPIMHFHILVDGSTTNFVLQTVHDLWCQNNDDEVNVSFYDVNSVRFTVQPYQSILQTYFTSANDPYYNKTVFFVEAVIHKILPEEVDKVLALDIDIKLNASVAELYEHFNNFSALNILGLAHEQQPTYRHYAKQYRARNHGTLVGEPHPRGRPGFNSGVVLVHLSRLRESKIYNELLEPKSLDTMTEKYSFHGSLGDQDFYTLMGFEYPELFYTLPCGWNRQLCRIFETQGYKEVFDEYHRCEGEIYLFHGNCNSTLPDI